MPLQNNSVAHIYIVLGDIMQAIMPALAGLPLADVQIAETGCAVGFENDSDLALLRLAMPPGIADFDDGDETIVILADPPYARSLVDPVLHQCSLQDRVQIAEFARIYLPTAQHHDRLMQMMRGAGVDAYFS
ncbi:hypothetical protein C8J30_1142 [Rhodobacter viridis]|uniref:Uncharacterized protein n=1 Tax=Rhodobacter viridis TaxID=1054202 RepID=A0A318TWD2_9RHOB|nr:hypothetical protein [Rhodobacter viridis]PYF08067.1 hypothetical protein C8J30_1142 [Rhodobacter viridis]